MRIYQHRTRSTRQRGADHAIPDVVSVLGAAVGGVQVVKRGPSRLIITVNIGPLGLGVSLAEEEGKVGREGGPHPCRTSRHVLA